MRFFRACIGRNDDFYNRYMVKNSIFHPIFRLTVSEIVANNLLSSACLEIFEYIRVQNVKIVLNHLVDSLGPELQALSDEVRDKISTFRLLLLKWAQNNDAEAVSSSTTKEVLDSQDLQETSSETAAAVDSSSSP